MTDDPPMFHDRDGKPLTLRRWLELHRDWEGYRRLAEDAFGNHRIVTAWLGTDQGFGLGDEPPLIFGTAVFDGNDLVTEVNTATEAEALAEHHATLERLRRETGER